MKNSILIWTGCIFLLIGCHVTPKLDGKFIKVKNNGLGLINEVTFGNNMCRLNYVGITMSGKYVIEGNYVYIDVGGIGTLAMEIIDNETLKGEGLISGTFKKQSSLSSQKSKEIEANKSEQEKENQIDEERKKNEEAQRAREAVERAFGN